MIDILDMGEVEAIIDDIVRNKNIARKRNEYINYEAGSGLLRKFVLDKVKAMYPKTWDTYTIAEFSLVKKVVDKKARAYKEPPVRKLEVESEVEAYQNLLAYNRFNDAMKELDRIYNQHKYAGLYFEPGSDTGEINFYPLRPYEYDVIKDDDGELECLILSYPGAQVTKGTQDSMIAGDRADDSLSEVQYVFWTKDNHIVVNVYTNGKGERKLIQEVPVEGNPNRINPYGVIPFAFIPYDFNEDYPSPSPLANQTIELNALLSVYLTSANMQVGQLVIKSPADQKIEQVSSGMMSAMQLPQSKNPTDKETTAEYISPSPDLAGHKEAITTYLSMILDEQGISSAQVLNAQEKFSSGLDRLLSQADVQSIIEDNQDFYCRLEQECFDIINAILGGFFKSEKLTVSFKKPKMLTSDSEMLANIEKMIEIGLIEDYEKFMIVDPNLSVEQAKAKLDRINESKSKSFSNLVSINSGTPSNTNGGPIAN